MKPFAKRFYLSKAWRQCRDAYFISVHGLCERCFKPGKIVHHKIELNPKNIDDTNITLNWYNLELLCQECHNKVHGNSATEDGLTFDDEGNLINVTPRY